MMMMMNCNTMQEQILAMLGEHNHQVDFSKTKSTSIQLTTMDQEEMQQGDDVDDSSSSSASTTSSFTNASSVLVASSMAEVESLLDELVYATHRQLHQEKLLDKCIQEQIALATSRHVMGSQLGVIVCMKNVHTLQMQRQRVNAAIQLLEGYIIKLESQLNYNEKDNNNSLMMHNNNNIDNLLMMIDMHEQKNYAQQVQRILYSSSSST